MAKYDTTKFYWLQLREDFFDEDAIDWLEEQPNGKEYSLFYLKLCLKSLSTNGVLVRKVGNMLVPYDHIKLGELTKTSPDTVMVAMNLLIQIGLVERLDNGELYMTQVEDMIGSQSKSAFKKQQQIARRKVDFLEGGKGVEFFPPEIEIEKEKELEIEKENSTRESRTDKRFVAPTLNEIREYCDERKNNVDAERFFDFYESKGWMVGKTKMKDWRAAVRTWEKEDNKKQTDGSKPNSRYVSESIPDFDDFFQAAMNRKL